MKNKLILLLLLSLFSINQNLSAQFFEEAPAPKVRQIVEWTQFQSGEDENVNKGGVYDFQEDGKLIRYLDEDHELERTFKYNKIGQIIEKTETAGFENVTYKYGYRRKYYVEEVDWGGRISKTFFYLNDKRQVIEKKEFDKLPEDKNYILDKRTIYSYTKHDSIQGETQYDYFIRSGSKTIEESWIIYTYDAKTGKRASKTHLSPDNVRIYFFEYEYDEQGRPTAIIGRDGDGEYENVTRYIYQDGQLLQKINISVTEGKKETVYKNGIPIREKSYGRKMYDGFYDEDPDAYTLDWITDFQYMYYK